MASTVTTTCTSLRRPSTNEGRRGRSIRRQVRIASVEGRPSRRKNEPGMRPAAYMRSSTSIVSGKKSKCSFGCLETRRGREQHGLVVDVGDGGALGLLGEATGLEADGAGAELAIVDDGFGERDFRTFQEVFSFVLRRTPCGRDSYVRSRNRHYETHQAIRSRWPPVEVHHSRSIGDPPQGTSFLPACSVGARYEVVPFATRNASSRVAAPRTAATHRATGPSLAEQRLFAR